MRYSPPPGPKHSKPLANLAAIQGERISMAARALDAVLRAMHPRDARAALAKAAEWQKLRDEAAARAQSLIPARQSSKG